jgi:hypothetical protein
MANLGSVEDRVAAYRGNPAPLQQRYQITQDLLDLLALQKIFSEKKTAARQLQMQMAQHQAAEGDPGAATVAQQREKEVAQLVGGVAQQDGAQKEAAMRQMMSGIANAPGAAAAAQPQAMAAGGIVGYAGPEGSQVEGYRESPRAGVDTDDLKPDSKESRLARARKLLQPEGRFVNPSISLPSGDKALGILKRIGSVAGRATGPLAALGAGASAVDLYNTPTDELNRLYYGQDRDPSVIGDTITRTRAALGFLNPFGNLSERLATQRGGGQASSNLTDPRSRASDTQEWDSLGIASPAPGAAAPRPSPARPAGSAPAAPAAAAAAPAPAAAAPTVADVENLVPSVQLPTARGPEAAYDAAYKRMLDAQARTPGEQRIYDAGIAQLERRLAERSDPERNRMDGIMQALLAGSRGGPRNIGALTGFAEGSIAANRQQRAEREALEKELQAMLSTGRAERLAGVDAAARSGQAAATTGVAQEGNVLQAATVQRGQSLQTLMSISTDQNRTAIATADRESRERIAAADRAIQSQRLALERSVRADDNAERNRIRIADGIRAVGESVQKSYAPMLNTLGMQMSMAGDDPKKLATARAAYAAVVSEMDERIKQYSTEYRKLQPSESLTFTGAATPR